MAIVPVDGKEGPADVCVIELGGTIGTLYIFFLMSCFPVAYIAEHEVISKLIEKLYFLL